MINQQYERAKQILKDKAAGHNQLAGILLEREIIYSDDLEKIFGKRPWISRSQEILENDKSSDEGLHLPSKPHGSGDHIFIDTEEKAIPGSPNKKEEQENRNSEE
jgi:cell division protease FtsH